MLINDFCIVSEVKKSENSIVCKLEFNSLHAIFGGHFPQQPVVPGVCMMQIVKEILESDFNRKLLLKSTGQVKFLQLITPDITPEFFITWKESEENYMVNAVCRTEKDLFKLTGNYQ